VSDPDFRFGSFRSRNLIDPDPRFDHTGFKILFQNGRILDPGGIFHLIQLSNLNPDSTHPYKKWFRDVFVLNL
jgi:hypothetical protein